VINLGAASSTGAATESTAPELTINIGQGSSASSASPEEVTINFGSGSSGETVSLGAAQGNSAELTVNLNQQSNNELILNLFNSNSATQSQSNSGDGLSVSA
jgi:hypothetical protein